MRKGDDLSYSAALLISTVFSVAMGLYLGRVIESINMFTECEQKAHYEFSSIIFVKPIAINCKVGK